MDPVSAIGLAASAAELIKLALAVIHLCSKAARGPSSRNTLALELASLVASLSNLKQRVDDAQSRNDPWFHAVSSLGGSQGPLEQFKATLEYLARKLEPRFGRAVVWLFSEAEINEALAKIERIKTTVTLAMQQDHLTLSQTTHDLIQRSDLKLGSLQEDLQTLDRGIQDIAVGIMNIDAGSSDERRRSIASWLSPLNFLGRHDDIYRRRHEGTNQWLLQAPEFQEWVGGKRTVLRCAGIPGGGKTMIASLVVEHIKSSHEHGRVAVLVMYCNYKEHAEQSVTNLLASLVKQLIQNGGPLSDDLMSLYRRHQDRSTRPTLQEICAILSDLIATYDKVYIVVDALDESPEYLGVRFNLATELLGFESESCNLLFTARNYAGLEDLFPETACIDIAATEEDLRSYVDARISQAPRLAKHARTHKGLRDEIINTVVGRASGMFLLVRLHMDSIEHKPTPKAVLNALHELPNSLSASYEGALERTENQNEDDRLLARRILYWTTYVERPLGVLEMRHALAVEDGETEFDEDNLVDEDIMLSACCGLVAIDGATRQIRLVHYTLQTYLETVRSQRFPEAQVSITESCLNYLSSDALAGPPSPSDSALEAYTRSHPFAVYAAQNWGAHGRGEVETQLPGPIMSLLQQELKRQRCAQIMNIPFHRYSGYSQAYPHDLNALWITAAFGLVETSRRLIDQGCDVNGVDSYRGQTALHRAAAAGHVDVVRLLLERQAALDIITTKRGFSPLREAVQRDHSGVASILIHAGADVASKARGGTQPLHGAASNGSVSILNLLLDHNADLDARDNASSTPLHVAADMGRVGAVECLLDRGADIEGKDRIGRSALVLAAAGGHIKTTTLLLSRGANPNSQDRDLSVPIMNAIEAGQLMSVQVLLEHGANANALDMYGTAPLGRIVGRIANRKEPKMLQLLLRWGADVNTKDADGWAPLHHAASYGDLAMVDTLLLHGAKVDVRDVRGETPLQQGAWAGYGEIVHRLLDGGAQIDGASSDGRTALHRAAGNAHNSIVAELIARGAKSQLQDQGGETAAQLAEDGGHQDVSNLLTVAGSGTFSPPSPHGRRGSALLQKMSSREEALPSPAVAVSPPKEPPIDPETLESNRKLADPAVLKALGVKAEDTTFELVAKLGFSLKAAITHRGPHGERKMFMKTRFNETTPDLYRGEFLGLQGMHRACPTSTPEPLAHGNFSASIGCFLVTEFLERRSDSTVPSPPPPTTTPSIPIPTPLSLAQKLATIHLAPTPIPPNHTHPVFGFPTTTYCGPTAQPNTFSASWHDFFVHDRLRMILHACEVSQGQDDELRFWVERTIAGPVAQLLGDGHLGGTDTGTGGGVKPALVHGNLWYGNKMRGVLCGRAGVEVDAGSGGGGSGGDSGSDGDVVEDVVFDPSSFWAHSEFEMGIVVLFGGFSAGFFQEYHALVPKTVPVEEYKDRLELYQLYHQLNHYALFGGKYRAESLGRMVGLCERFPEGK